MAGKFQGGSAVPGTFDSSDLKDQANIKRSQMEAVTLDVFPINFLDLKEAADLTVPLPNAAASTNLGLITGATYGTNPPTVQSGDCKASTTTRRARSLYQLPNTYVAGAQVSIFAIAGMITTVAGTSALLAIEAYEINDDGTLSSQLVTGGAQSINSLTLATLNFPLTAVGLVPGSRLDIRFSIAIIDSATVTAVIGELLALYFKCNSQP